MGMFDKDKEIGRSLTGEFAEREEFILWAIRVDDEKIEVSSNNLPPAEKTRMAVSKEDAPTATYEVTTLGSAIANKAREAEPGDFPAWVKWLKVSTNYGNDATVIQFVREYDGPRPTRSDPPNQPTPSDSDADPLPF